MRIAFVFCTGEVHQIDHVAQLLHAEDLRHDRYPSRNPVDHYGSFRVDLDSLGDGPTIPMNATAADVSILLLDWSRTLDIPNDQLHVDQVNLLSFYSCDDWSGFPLDNQLDITEDQWEVINATVEDRREAFHRNDPEDPDEFDGDDGDGDGDDDEPVEHFHTVGDHVDDDGDDDENIVYDEADPLE